MHVLEQQLTLAVNHYYKVMRLGIDEPEKKVRIDLRMKTVIYLNLAERGIATKCVMLGQPILPVILGFGLLALVTVISLMIVLGPSTGLAQFSGFLCILAASVFFRHGVLTLCARDAAKEIMRRNWIDSIQADVPLPPGIGRPRPVFLLIVAIFVIASFFLMLELYERANTASESATERGTHR